MVLVVVIEIMWVGLVGVLSSMVDGNIENVCMNDRYVVIVSFGMSSGR